MKKLKKLIFPAAAVLLWLGIWWLVALLIGKPLLLPTPLAVVKKLLALSLTAKFWQNVGLSLLRVLLGLSAALILGLGIALLTARSKRLHTLLAPPLYAMKTTPVVAVIFLLLLWFGKNTVPALVTLSVALPIVWNHAETALAQTDRTLLEMARVFQVPPRRVLREVKLPAAGNALLCAVRASVGLAFKAGIAAEVLAVPRAAIGSAIFQSNLYTEIDALFAYTLTVLLFSR